MSWSVKDEIMKWDSDDIVEGGFDATAFVTESFLRSKKAPDKIDACQARECNKNVGLEGSVTCRTLNA
jgi:hypothetical protein